MKPDSWLRNNLASHPTCLSDWPKVLLSTLFWWPRRHLIGSQAVHADSVCVGGVFITRLVVIAQVSYLITGPCITPVRHHLLLYLENHIFCWLFQWGKSRSSAVARYYAQRSFPYRYRHSLSDGELYLMGFSSFMLLYVQIVSIIISIMPTPTPLQC